MTFTSTHKEALNNALRHWFVDEAIALFSEADMDRYRKEMEASIFAYVEERGAKIVPLEPTEKMVIAGVHHENMGDMAGRYTSMLSASPDPFADEVAR